MSPVGGGVAAGPLTVVTGVPRSGTSLLMQLLARGGMPVTTDGVRRPDESNPRGYFEHEAVKGLGSGRLSRDELAAMADTAVKIVAPLVLRLPAGLRYRVLLVRREVAEIVESQRRMLARAGVPAAAGSDEALARAITRSWLQVRTWAAGNPDAELLELDYAELVHQPRRSIATINAFLGGGLAVEPMAGAVDPALHRNRATLCSLGVAAGQTCRVP
ncbi:MAG TPA: hypothetical protein VFU36_09120 [Jatrophihabitans sp.]|nr:hypothetical protein [Jatrophihabitans sp.]